MSRSNAEQRHLNSILVSVAWFAVMCHCYSNYHSDCTLGRASNVVSVVVAAVAVGWFQSVDWQSPQPHHRFQKPVPVVETVLTNIATPPQSSRLVPSSRSWSKVAKLVFWVSSQSYSYDRDATWGTPPPPILGTTRQRYRLVLGSPFWSFRSYRRHTPRQSCRDTWKFSVAW